MKLMSKTCIGIVLGTVSTTPLLAGGFQIFERNTSDLGRAYAGGAAIAEDASTIATNPAGLVRMRSPEFNLSLSTVLAEFQVETKSAGVNIPGLGLQKSQGLTTDDAAPDGIPTIPAVYASFPINNRVVVGLGAFSNFSTASDYEYDFSANLLALESEITTININPSLGYRINREWSVGFGVNAVLAEATLSSANPAVGPLTDEDTGAFLINPATGQVIQGPTGGFVGFSEIKGNDFAYGWNAGVMYQASRNFRVGLSYRSEVDLELDGTIKFIDTPNVDAFTDLNGRAPLTLPEIAQASVYWKPTDSLGLAADVSFTGWRSFQKLEVIADDGRLISEVPEEWTDSYRYAIGMDYTFDRSWKAKAGLSYDESPIPDERRTLRIPTNDLTWASLGVTYRPIRELIIDFGYARIFMEDTEINDERIFVGQSFVGEANTVVSANIDVLSLQATYRI